MSAFEIKDSNIDMAEIARIVTERSQQRQIEARRQGLDVEQLSQPVSLPQQLQETTVWILDLIDTHQANILIQPYAISPKQGIFSSLAAWLRRPFHDLVIYYVNLLGKKQISFNKGATWLIGVQQARIERLQERVDRLELEIQQLKSQLTGSATQTNG